MSEGFVGRWRVLNKHVKPLCCLRNQHLWSAYCVPRPFGNARFTDLRREPSGDSSQVCWKPALCSSAKPTLPSSLERAVGGTRCSGGIQRDAIWQESLFLESRDSRWWAGQPQGQWGDVGRAGSQGFPSAGGWDRQAESRVYSVLRTMLPSMCEHY